MQNYAVKKIHLKMSAKKLPFCSGLSVFMHNMQLLFGDT